ncbi:MAG: smc 3 [Anaerocolumna sp.]|nr:smc 3 [Anaerocolumna sp.]
MIKGEWKRLLKNKTLLVVLVAIIAIPTIYTTLFLGSMWDPYGKLVNLPVAVVNDDISVTYNDKTLSVGADLVENLKEEDSLAFNFVDSKTALRGLENGTYYMVITIPENFSQNATTVLEDNPKKMELQYATNPGTNYIASKMSETAVNKIKDSISDKVTEVYAQSVFDSIEEIGDGMQTAADGSRELSDGITKAVEGVNSYTEGVSKVADGAKELVQNNDALNQGVTNLTSGVTTLKDGSNMISEGLSTMSSTLGNTIPKESDIEALKNGLDSYNTGINQLNTALQGMSASSVAGSITESLTSIGDNTKAAAGSVGSIAEALTVLSTANLNQAQLQALQTIGVSASSLGSNLNTIGMQTQKVATDFTTLGAGLSKIEDLKNGVKKLSDNSALVLNGSKTAIDGLYKGLGTVKLTLDSTIIPGSASLTQGMEEVLSGINGESGLKSGIKAYTDGAKEIDSGVIKLDDKSEELKDGMKELLDGEDKLSEELNKGATKVNDTNLSEASKKMFSSPVEVDETMITTVKNNGHAMAAYMMSVALWVACIAFCIMYPLTEFEGELKSGTAWWASKASVLFPIAIAQALLMLFMLNHINGFAPMDSERTVFVACLASVAFMAIMYFFNVWLGKVGSFIMLIFMVVQLAGSAGTYPIELSESFVGKIHKYLPFSYTVEAFRNSISGAGYIYHAVVMLSVIFVVFTVLTIMIFQVRTRRIKKGKPVLTDLLTGGGLS